MAITKLKYLLCVLASCLALLGPTTSQIIIPPVVDLLKHRLFIFGDSLFDPGNSFYFAGDNVAMHLPYGMTLNDPTGRFSDGRLVPDYIALFAGMSVMPPYLKPGANFTDGANFAYAGSRVLGSARQNLKGQLGDFMTLAATYVEQYGQTTATLLMKRSVFLLNLGGVDYLQLYGSNPNPTDSQKADQVNWVVGNLSSALTEIYNVGGRRIAFQNVAPLGCMPGTKQGQQIGHDACYEPYNEVVKLHNSALLKALTTLKTQLLGFEYVVFDYFNSVMDRIQNPTNYGFQVGDVACCGTGTNRGGGCSSTSPLCPDPNQYVYFDGGHTGQNTNYQLAQLLWNGGTNVTTPYNMKQFFGLL